MWRWSELLPIFEPQHIITLGEGDTPLLHLKQLGNKLRCPNLFIKEEALNPTGSFKARGIAAAVSKAVELGIRKIVIPSAGNAGGALAAYAARAGINSLVYMPVNTPKANIEESRITGSTVELIDGSIADAAKYAHIASQSQGWFNMSTFKEPYRVEGKKIMGYEIAESFTWKLPDVIIYPTGGGTGLIGMWKAFQEMVGLGWLESTTLPRMIAVQANGCAPVVKAFGSNETHCEYWQNASTIASGLRVPLSFADREILRCIRDSHGYAVSVSDEEILNSQRRIARDEGIFTCPEGAATLAGLEKLLGYGVISVDETIILFNTGSGLKYITS
jgi:threonine synthase